MSGKSGSPHVGARLSGMLPAAICGGSLAIASGFCFRPRFAAAILAIASGLRFLPRFAAPILACVSGQYCCLLTPAYRYDHSRDSGNASCFAISRYRQNAFAN
jgi:hypothetical protein